MNRELMLCVLINATNGLVVATLAIIAAWKITGSCAFGWAENFWFAIGVSCMFGLTPLVAYHEGVTLAERDRNDAATSVERRLSECSRCPCCEARQ